MEFSVISFICFLIVVAYIYIKVYRFFVKERFKLQGFALVKGLFINSIVILAIIKFPNYFNLESFEFDVYIVIAFVFLILWVIALSDHSNIQSNKFKIHNPDNGTPLELKMGIKKYAFKKVFEFKNEQVPIYPRFTVQKIADSSKIVLFDSSDYEQVNKTFGTSSKQIKSEYFGNCQSIYAYQYVNINEKQYRVEKVQVDILDFFDDYTIAKSDKNDGDGIPYNIQIFIDVVEIKMKTI